MQKEDYLIKGRKYTSKKNIDVKKLKFLVNSKNNVKNKMIILDLLYRGKLDRFIGLLDDEKIYINHNSLIKKAYVTKREHFVYLLDNFISYFVDTFNNFDLIYMVIPSCINCAIGDIFLSDCYLYDNFYVDFYINKFNLMIIDAFYNNLLHFKDCLAEEIKKANLKLDIEDIESVNNLFMFLEEICFVNRNHYALLSLFSKVNDDNCDLYLSQWKLLFANYFDNIEFVKMYREFKIKNNL